MSKRRKIASPDLADDPIMRKKSAKDKSNEKIMKWSSDDISKTTFAQHRNFAQITQKSDIDNRPMWVCPNGIVYLDTGSPLYKRASDFLVAIADPLCRPKFMHEYKITSYSLYAAASLGLTTEDIITSLSAFSKIELHDDLKKFIQENTEKCGKVKLLLKKTRYFVESPHVHILHELLDDPVINDARIDDKEKKKTDKDGGRGSEKEVPSLGVSGSLAALEKNKKHRYHHLWEKKIKALKAKANDLEEERDEETGFLLVSGQPTTVYIPGTGATTTDKDGKKQREMKKADARVAMGVVGGLDTNDAMGSLSSATAADDRTSRLAGKKILSFEIAAEKVESVRRRTNELGYPMIEEYDFRKDTFSADLPISLKPSTSIRPYQEKSLSKVFGNGRARSGIVVLPCGAGKTLTGITAAATIRKSTLVFCTTGVAVDQWRRQFLKWTSLPEHHICTFTGAEKNTENMRFSDSLVVITTYHMVAYNQKRSKEAESAMQIITSQEWGCVLLDEVHVAPANKFRRCINLTHSRCKIGLTATLVREDDLIDDLYFMVGPKLYEANWLDLSAAGYIAKVECLEVWCQMTPEFYQYYLTSTHLRKKLLYAMNPNKYRACEYLIKLHEERGDKVLVFSDNVYALKTYALAMKKLFIYGGTGDAERKECLHKFQFNPNINCLFISKVGDNSIDLPDVNVIIQISSHFASRRQEAQRLGRILRPKNKAKGRFNAFFYTLVSKDTKEMMYSSKRQRFLIDQGYSFKIITDLDIDNNTDLALSTKEEQLDLLTRCLSIDENSGDTEQLDTDFYDQMSSSQTKTKRRRQTKKSSASSSSSSSSLMSSSVSRRRGNMSSLSGGGDRGYAEYKSGDGAAKSKSKSKSSSSGGSSLRGAWAAKNKARKKAALKMLAEMNQE